MSTSVSIKSTAQVMEGMAAAWGVTIPKEAAGRIFRYFELLLQWNRTINLTGATSVSELVEDHLADSIALASLMPSGPVVDVGAGGGLPGVGFGILRPDCELTMVEPRGRRAAFLRTALRTVGLPGSVLESRIESVPSDKRFAGGFSRATFAPVDWIGHAALVVADGGKVGVLTTPDEATVLQSAGLRAVEERTYKLRNGRQRVVLAFLVPRGTKEGP